jgi:hypothetical protein
MQANELRRVRSSSPYKLATERLSCYFKSL